MRNCFAVKMLAVLAAVLFFAANVYAQEEGSSDAGSGKSQIDFGNFQPWAGVGAGFGTQFGGIGGNVDIQLVPYFGLTGGFGSTMGLGMAVGGLRIYAPTPVEKWQIRLSILGGNVAAAKIDRIYGEDEIKPLGGFAVGMESLVSLDKRLYVNVGVYYVSAQYNDGYLHEEVSQGTITVGLGTKFDIPKDKINTPAIQSR